jgi:hypothetical protein
VNEHCGLARSLDRTLEKLCASFLFFFAQQHARQIASKQKEIDKWRATDHGQTMAKTLRASAGFSEQNNTSLYTGLRKKETTQQPV